ncbi:MAG: hypothetical protein SFY81_13895 [Verrucomicrobiota bacterium]|nr:hypothetical protein [Verrucomicrobiota bacterium]
MLSQPKKRTWITLGVIIALILVLGYLSSTPEPEGSLLPPAPNPNSYDLLVKAANSFTENPSTVTNNFGQFVTNNLLAFQQIAEAVRLPGEVPESVYSPTGMTNSGLSEFRKIAYAYRIKGKFEEANKEWNQAAQTYLQLIQAGQISEKGPILAALVGISLQSMALEPLMKLVEKLSLSESAELAAGLEIVKSSRIHFDEVIKREEYFRLKSKPNKLLEGVLRLLGISQKRIIDKTKAKRELATARLEVVAAASAVRHYDLKERKILRSLDQLPGDYMKSVPLDPYTGKALLLQRTGRIYLIYSVGPNQKDEKGLEDDIAILFKAAQEEQSASVAVEN